MPWNFLICEAGDVISTITSKSDILTTAAYVKLIAIASLFLLPPLIKRCISGKEKERERAAARAAREGDFWVEGEKERGMMRIRGKKNWFS